MSNPNRVQKLFLLINYLRTPPSKSIRNLSQYLETSCRTVYRYLEMLEELGYTVKKDSNGKLLMPQGSGLHQVSFTREEVMFLISIIKNFGTNKALSEILVNKLSQNNNDQFTPYFASMIDGITGGTASVHLFKN